jgi:putative transposase
VREAGVIVSQAVLIAIGIDWDGRRQILGVELANRESRSSWKEFLVDLKARGLAGVELVVSDDFTSLSLVICASVWPFDQGSVMAARVATRSPMMPSAK